jgi:Holliday junction DNA helicase RuvA
MYDYVKGRLEELTPAVAVVEASGVGYSLLISLQTYSMLEKADPSEVKVYVHHTVNQQSAEEEFFGFHSKEERNLFELLISVSGVGPNSARMMLSGMTPDEMRSAIVGGDLHKLQSVKGIGAKTAQRIILELKDKVVKGDGAGLNVIGGQFGCRNTAMEEAASALVNLGFSRPNVDKALNAILKESPNDSLEVIIKKALKIL